VGGWVKTPDAHWSWMYQRGAMIGYFLLLFRVTAALINESIVAFTANTQLLLKNYAPPQTVKEAFLFGRAVFKMENFRAMMRSRSQYALAIGLTDISTRIAMFRQFNNGW